MEALSRGMLSSQTDNLHFNALHSVPRDWGVFVTSDFQEQLATRPFGNLDKTLQSVSSLVLRIEEWCLMWFTSTERDGNLDKTWISPLQPKTQSRFTVTEQSIFFSRVLVLNIYKQITPHVCLTVVEGSSVNSAMQRQRIKLYCCEENIRHMLFSSFFT